jgi:hypothetical protein
MVGRGLGLVVVSALLWAVALAASRYGAAGILGIVFGLGVPAIAVGNLACRAQLPRPLLWALASYCLASGIATAYLMGADETPTRYVTVALAHAASLTTAMPLMGGGIGFSLMNVMWVVVVALVAGYGAEMCRSGRKAAAEVPPAPREG